MRLTILPTRATSVQRGGPNGKTTSIAVSSPRPESPIGQLLAQVLPPDGAQGSKRVSNLTKPALLAARLSAGEVAPVFVNHGFSG
jgi:hypothetical protein